MASSSSSSSSAAAAAAASSPQHQLKLNPRGIPHAPFISNVQQHLGAPDEDVEPTLRKFQETMSKYKFMEMNTAQRRRGLEEKIPDIRKTLQMVEFLKEKKDDTEPIKTTFELNDTLYAKAELQQTDKVHLWLGANVMLSYPLDEAIQLLSTKLEGAEKSLVAAKEDLDFLREQITIMEVNTARVHNWDVKRRRERREELEKQGLTSGGTAKASSWLYQDGDSQEAGGSKGGTEEEANPKDGQPPGSLSQGAEQGGNEWTTAVTVEGQEQNCIPPTSGGGGGGGASPSRTPAAAAAPTASTTPPPAPLSNPSTSDSTTPHTPITTTPASFLDFPPSGTIVPPLNFDMVARGIYRSGHPNERNFGFLHRLGLKTVVYLANEEYRPNMANWAKQNGIRILHYRLDLNKEPLAEMDATTVTHALRSILDPSNHPMLLHCNKGKYRVGCIVGLIRRIQGWSHTSIFEEYARFAGSKIADVEWIEVFDVASVRRA
ncbi:hypothetical protein ACQY0O_007900 [Thecaphora frezii]